MNTDSWLLRQDNTPYGPVPLHTLRIWICEKKIQRRDMISSDGGATWSLAERVPELAGYFPSDAFEISEVPKGYIGKVERRKKSIEVIDMLPMIDMVFLLLIFFALTSSFELNRYLKMKIPEAASSQHISQDETVTVQITQDNKLFLRGREIDLLSLQRWLRERLQKSGPFGLVIKGDENVRHGLIVKVLDVAQAVGLAEVFIATSQAAE